MAKVDLWFCQFCFIKVMITVTQIIKTAGLWFGGKHNFLPDVYDFLKIVSRVLYWMRFCNAQHAPKNVIIQDLLI